MHAALTSNVTNLLSRKHAAVLERAGGMLRNNETKLTTFKSHVSSYQKGRVTAAGLVDLVS